jgi:hypothetical protein
MAVSGNPGWSQSSRAGASQKQARKIRQIGEKQRYFLPKTPDFRRQIAL